MKKKLLGALLVTLLVLIVLTISTGFGGPTSNDIRIAVKEKLSKSIDLSQLKINRSPKFALSADQLIIYSADVVINEDYVQRLNPFAWQDQCEGGRDQRTVNTELASTAVHEILAIEGTKLALVGQMRAYKKEGEWNFTARSRRLMNNETNFSGTPLSAVNNVLLTQSAEFVQLCQSVFLD